VKTEILDKRFCSFLENIKNWNDIKSRKNEEEGRTLAYIYICPKVRRNKVVPDILALYVN